MKMKMTCTRRRLLRLCACLLAGILIPFPGPSAQIAEASSAIFYSPEDALSYSPHKRVNLPDTDDFWDDAGEWPDEMPEVDLTGEVGDIPAPPPEKTSPESPIPSVDLPISPQTPSDPPQQSPRPEDSQQTQEPQQPELPPQTPPLSPGALPEEGDASNILLVPASDQADIPPPVLEASGALSLAVSPGEAFTVSVPIRAAYDGIIYESDLRADGQALLPYAAGSEPLDYHQAIAQILSEARVTLHTGAMDAARFASEGLRVWEDVVSGGINYGYAVFSGFHVPPDTPAGTYTLALQLAWTDLAPNAQEQTLPVYVSVTVEPVQVATLDLPLALEQEDEITVIVGEYTSQHVLPGNSFDLAVSIEAYQGDSRLESNRAPDSDATLPYAAENGPSDYDQTIAGMLSFARLELPANAGSSQVFDLSAATLHGDIVKDGVNSGYAVLEGVRILPDAPEGVHTLPLLLLWQEDSLDATPQQVATVLAVTVGEPPLGNAMVWHDGIIVYNYTELRAAIIGGMYHTIYLGTNSTNNGVITYSDRNGIPVDHGITINGLDPNTGQYVRLVDAGVRGAQTGLYATQNNIFVLFRNVTINSDNDYGIFNGAQRANVSTAFENVTFTGRKLVTNTGSGSQLLLNSSTISIQSGGTGSSLTLADAETVRLFGNITLTRTGSDSTSMFTFSSGQRPTIIVEAGADVTVQSTGPLATMDNNSTTSAASSLTVEGKMTLTTTGGDGAATKRDDYFGTVRIENGGNLTINHNNSSRPSLLANALTVDGTLNVLRTSSLRAVIRMQPGGIFNVNATGSMVVEDLSGGLINVDSGSGTMTWITRGVDRYDTNGQLTSWYNADGSPFTVTFSLNSSGGTLTSVTGLENGGRGAAPGAPVLAGTAINLNKDTRIRLGDASSAPKPTVELAFEAVPPMLVFRTVSLSAENQLIKRLLTGWQIVISDPSPASVGFKLLARIEGPLTSFTGDVLQGSLVFVENSTSTPLTLYDMELARRASGSAPGLQTVSWTENEGLLVWLPAFTGEANTPYLSSIIFSLVSGP